MNDPEISKKILQIFSEELNEQTQSITNALIALEKGNLTTEESEKIIESIFRSAHNIKGSARGVGALDVGNISHHIETLFSAIKNKTLTCSRPIIDLSLEAIDGMRSAMESFSNNTPLTFDLEDMLCRLAESKNANVPNKITPVKEKINTGQSETKPTNSDKEHETIRVSIKNLERVSALVEEIQVNKISLEEHYENILNLCNATKKADQTWKQMGDAINTQALHDKLNKLYNSSNAAIRETSYLAEQIQKNMKKFINELSTLSHSLQEELKTLRLIPAAFLLDTLPRITRDIAHELKKNVDLMITGSSVKMDKLILEGLQNPLIHLLRNAIDHGIEDPETRRKLGKSEIATIQINVQDEGDRILISISDDGTGIDIKKIAATAQSKNILSKSALENMNDAAILDLIFSAGFSTKDIITDISGRGVGLDIVKSNIQKLKGDVSISTQVNIGTTFNLRLPLTLASERGLIIKCAEQLFVIPTSIIEHVLLLKPDDIIDLEASQAIILNKHPIPLRSLADILGISRNNMKNNAILSTLVLRNENHAVALLVDEIISEREMVVKPLNLPLSHVPLISGGTLAANGQAIIVLNSNDLMKIALKYAPEAKFINHDPSEHAKNRVRILVVDDSITTRTLEKNILESKDYEVTVAVNGKEAWDILQKQKFSLLITDINMPIMDGFSLTENVKNSETLRDMPVIIVTSLESDDEKKRGIEVGANAYLVKNQFESQALLQIVEQLV